MMTDSVTRDLLDAFKAFVDKRFELHEKNENQGLANFQQFMAQRFIDQDELRRSERTADNRLLDERFKTQTTTLDAAFAAAEKARQEALSTAREDTARTDARIKALEDKRNEGSGRLLGHTEVFSWLTTAAVVAGTVLYHFH